MGRGGRPLTAVLLDTHVLVWLIVQPTRLSPAAAAAIKAADTLLVSAVSIYEIDNKRRKRRVPELDALPGFLIDELPEKDFELIGLSPRAAQRAATFPFAHADPFDRMLLAQATELGVPLISSDRQFRELTRGGSIIW